MLAGTSLPLAVEPQPAGAGQEVDRDRLSIELMGGHGLLRAAQFFGMYASARPRESACE